LVRYVLGPPRWGASQWLVLRQLLVIAAIQAKSFRLQLPNPGSDNGSQGSRGKFIQAAFKELHQLINIADVERVCASIFIVLLTVTKALGDMLLLSAPARSTPLKRLTQYLSLRGLMGWLDNRRREFWHGFKNALHLRCRVPQVLEARNRLVGALCTAIGGCDRPDALGNRRWKDYVLWFVL
jgi:hypothetical protein